MARMETDCNMNKLRALLVSDDGELDYKCKVHVRMCVYNACALNLRAQSW